MKVVESRLLCLLVVVVVFFALESKGQICDSTFFGALMELMPCQQAVNPFAALPPSEACCAAIQALGQPCLCLVLNGPTLPYIDRTIAVQLPDQCSANFPPCTPL